MIKKKVVSFTIFTILVILSLVNFLPVTHGIDAIISDTEDDVFQECATGNSTGNYHDEIDITKLTIAGQNVNLTVAGNLANWNGRVNEPRAARGVEDIVDPFCPLFRSFCLPHRPRIVRGFAH